MEEGLLVVISGPSGAGKGTICMQLLLDMSFLKVSVSATTRKPREGEKDGVDYYFIDEEEFLRRVANNEFLEYAKVYGNYYGTPKEEVFKQLKAGNDIILEIDIQGALQVKKNYPLGVFIFILPPSLTELKNRIEGRGTDSKEVILRRMESAYDELNYAFQYDYVVVNDRVDLATEKIKHIILAEKKQGNKKKRNNQQNQGDVRMKKIPIDELNEMVDSQYSLVTIISKRARQIIDGSEPLIKTKTKKPIAIAIEEFYAKKISPIYDYDKYKKALAANAEKTEDAEGETKEITEDVKEDKKENPSTDGSDNQSND